MTAKISLTASMRSNLLSLQNISRQVSSVQNKLATGNKVNSAIDNPSSYYTARALNNRAEDLNALLNSMGQAVSTIKAATTALEAGAGFLEQAAAVATQALDQTAVPQGAVIVKTESDLRAALADGSNQEIIIAGDIVLTSKIELGADQKLSGMQAYDNSQRGRLIFNFAADVAEAVGIELANNSRISFLDIEYTNAADIGDIVNGDATDMQAVSIIKYHGDQTIYLNDVNIKGISSGDVVGVYNDHGQVVFSGNININLSGEGVFSIGGNPDALVEGKYTVVQEAGSVLSIKAQGSTTVGLFGALTELNGDSYIDASIGMAGVVATLNGTLNIAVPEKDGNSFVYADISVAAGGRLNLSDTNTGFWSGSFAAGAVVMNPDGIYQVVNDTDNSDIGSADFQRIGDYNPALLVPAAGSSAQSEKLASEDSFLQYRQVLNQYDSLIKDAPYKGINLLQDNALKVRFNEAGSAALNVSGKDMSSAALGLSAADWQTQADIAQSLSEISAALKSIRSFSAELGNNYSIITGRQDFTENLINILTEGADKLTLADMNEESANMLALQTRQQLAVNSLSLASQASQAVLKLF